jgi:3-oxoacyl-[acyl-carrier-protein] synthase-1
MIYLNQLGMICPLGDGLDDIAQRLLELGQSGLSNVDDYSPGRKFPVGPDNGAWPLPYYNEYQPR